jgi:hypothetical protein
MEKKIVARVEDLMFRAKIEAAARNLNVPVHFVEKAEELDSACKSQPAAAFVELTSATLSAISRLKKSSAGKDVPVIGFLSHVDTKLAAESTAQGVDRVLSRSAFSESLPELILEFTSPGVELKMDEEPELPEE